MKNRSQLKKTMSLILLGAAVVLGSFSMAHAEKVPYSNTKTVSPHNLHSKAVRNSRAKRNYRPKVYVKHGFRMGGAFIGNMDQKDLQDSGLVVPYMFLMGYELIEHIVASDSLSIVFAQNIMIGGFEQNRFVLNANAVIGLDILDTIQFGAGINLTPGATSWSHLIAFVSWTPKVGEVFLPITFSYVPDVYGHFRLGLTVGVSWSSV